MMVGYLGKAVIDINENGIKGKEYRYAIEKEEDLYELQAHLDQLGNVSRFLIYNKKNPMEIDLLTDDLIHNKMVVAAGVGNMFYVSYFEIEEGMQNLVTIMCR